NGRAYQRCRASCPGSSEIGAGEQRRMAFRHVCPTGLEQSQFSPASALDALDIAEGHPADVSRTADPRPVADALSELPGSSCRPAICNVHSEYRSIRGLQWHRRDSVVLARRLWFLAHSLVRTWRSVLYHACPDDGSVPGWHGSALHY